MNGSSRIQDGASRRAGRLRGSWWAHPRGHDPLVATAAEFGRRTGGRVEIAWQPRTLSEFGVTPAEQVAADHDLLVIDHPHVGDAAAQVSVYRPDRLPGPPPRRWADVADLAGRGMVLWPLGPTDAFASFLTLAANLGAACGTAPSGFGLAVSARCRDRSAALRYARWVSSAAIHRGLWFDAGGQPASARAWDDSRLDQISGGFFSRTRATLDGSWTRPPHPGYPAFPAWAAERLHAYLT